MEENKQKKRLFNQIFIIICLTLIFTGFLWAIDISASALIMNSATGEEIATLEGLWGERSPQINYHLGLLGIVACFLIVCALYLYQILKKA